MLCDGVESWLIGVIMIEGTIDIPASVTGEAT